MTDFEAIDALLARAKQETPLPPVEERRPLREALNVSRAQLAQALGVAASTVGGWESGRDPSGEVREKYAYFLNGARTKLDTAATADAEPAVEPAEEPAEADEPADLDDVDELADPQPCVLCGQPAHHQVEGFPQHLDPTDCGPAPTAPATEPAPEPAGHPETQPPAATDRPVRQAGRSVKVVPVGRRMQSADTPDPITSTVTTVLTEHAGDTEAATAALVKRAIPDAMQLLDHTRKGAATTSSRTRGCPTCCASRPRGAPTRCGRPAPSGTGRSSHPASTR